MKYIEELSGNIGFFHSEILLGLMQYNVNVITCDEILFHIVDHNFRHILAGNLLDLILNRSNELVIHYDALNADNRTCRIKTQIQITARTADGSIKDSLTNHKILFEYEKDKLSFSRDFHQLTEALFNYLPVGIALLNYNRTFSIVNPFFCVLLKYTQKEISEKPVSDIISKNDVEVIQEIFAQLENKHENTISRQIKLYDKNKNDIWVNANFSLLNINTEEGAKYVMTFKDISQWKSAEFELIKSEKKFKTLFEESNDLIFITNNSGRILNVNKKACELSGFDLDEVLQLNIDDILKKNNNKSLQSLLGDNTDGSLSLFDMSFRNEKKIHFLLEIHSKPIVLDNQNVIMHISKDVTERMNIQRQIFNAIMMAEEGERQRFAREVHDDLGPVLTAAKLYMKSLEKITDATKFSNTMQKSINIINDAIQIAKDISFNLSPHLLQNYGLIPALEEQFKKLNHDNNAILQIKNNLISRLDNGLENHLYRFLVDLMKFTILEIHSSKIIIHFNQNGEKLLIKYFYNSLSSDIEQLYYAKNQKNHHIFTKIDLLQGKIAFERLSDSNLVIIEINS